MTEQFLLRLDNWTRWCAGRGLYHRAAPVSLAGEVMSSEGRALSLEGNYRCESRPDDTPTGWGDWLSSAPVQPRPAIDIPDAVLVNRAYVRLATLTARQARIIRIMTFKAHWRPQWQAQKLGIHYLELPSAYYRARLMLAHQLEILDKQAHYARTVKPVYMTL